MKRWKTVDIWYIHFIIHGSIRNQHRLWEQLSNEKPSGKATHVGVDWGPGWAYASPEGQNRSWWQAMSPDVEESSFFKPWRTFFLGGEHCETLANLEKTHPEMVASYMSCMYIRKPDLCMDWSTFYLILDFIGCLTIHQPTKACERPRAKSPVRFAPRRARRTPLPAK